MTGKGWGAPATGAMLYRITIAIDGTPGGGSTVSLDGWRAERIAAALLNYADDEGYFNANPGLVKAACSPLRESSVSTHTQLKRLAEISGREACAWWAAT